MLLQQQGRKSHFIYISLLLVTAITGYWQLAFLKYSVPNDMINCWIPWRFYISECLQNHIFPFWNPYQQLGYPIHADLQGPIWYIESLLLGSTIGESNYAVQLLFVFYTFIAGTGMYFLSLCFHSNKNAAFVSGVCYLLSGFFISHVQHFYAVIGAAWLPFIILNYYKMHADMDYKRAIYAALFLFLNLTGGNHTFTFILFYLFICISGYFIFIALKQKKREIVFRLIKLNALFAALTAALSAVLIVVFIQVRPYVGRLSGMSYSDTIWNPFSPQSLLSLLVPFSNVNSRGFYNTDPSMCNIYMGILFLPFVLLALIRSKNIFEKILCVFAGVCLAGSFGAYTPVYKIIYNVVPFMNLFRFPSYFSLFTLIIFLILGSRQLAFNISSFTISRHKLLTIIVMLMALIAALVVFSAVKNNGSSFFFFNQFDTIFDFIDASNFYQNIIFQGTIQLLLLAALLIFILKAPAASLIRIITVFAVVDMLLAAQLNLAYTGMSRTSPKELHNYISSLPKKFPLPSLNNISENTEELGQKKGLFRNTSVFHKRISADGYNSFCFAKQTMLQDSLSQLYDSMLHNPLVYFSNDICSEEQFLKKSSAAAHSSIVLKDADYKTLSSKISKAANAGAAVKITAFSPEKITAEVDAAAGGLVTLLQNQYTGWKVFVDGDEKPVLLSNYITMSVYVPAGAHLVTFRYKNIPVIIGAVISYSVFVLLLVFLLVVWIRKIQGVKT
jgi:hypothetical protein